MRDKLKPKKMYIINFAFAKKKKTKHKKQV